jgi:hypothetical protein
MRRAADGPRGFPLPCPQPILARSLWLTFTLCWNIIGTKSVFIPSTPRLHFFSSCSPRPPALTRSKLILSYPPLPFPHLSTHSFFSLVPFPYHPAIFENYVAEIQLDGKPVQLALWDTAGQEEYEVSCPFYSFRSSSSLAFPKRSEWDGC